MCVLSRVQVYQWKLLNHVARDHNMTLKPAHLSYKCTVCTATFGMYKQFENHVYSAHSVVAKRVMDKKSSTSGASPSAASKVSLSNANSTAVLSGFVVPNLPEYRAEAFKNQRRNHDHPATAQIVDERGQRERFGDQKCRGYQQK